MPYIKTEKKYQITPVLKGDRQRVEMDFIDCAGDLNYAFTMLAINYIERKGTDYQHINDIVGALEGAKCEFQRRVVASYENVKAHLNGDVYQPEIDSDVETV